MKSLNNIIVFGKFKNDSSLDYVSQKVLVNYDGEKGLHVVDGIDNLLKNLLISHNLMDEKAKGVDNEAVSKAANLGYIKVVDVDQIDEEFYKNIVENENRDELTPEEIEIINKNSTGLEEKEEMKKTDKQNLDKESDDFEEVNLYPNNNEKSSVKDDEELLDEDIEEVDEADRSKAKFGMGTLAAVAGASAIGGAVLGAAGRSLASNFVKPKTETVKNVSEENENLTIEEQGNLEETLAAVDKSYENKEETTTSSFNEEYSSDVVINETTKQEARSNSGILDFDLSNGTEVQKEFLNSTAELITKFHEQTHKANNFRLENDNEHYLDLTLDEAMSLNLMLNDYTQDEINQIFGSHQFNSEKIQNSVKSAYTKLATYYMNAKEKSGVADIIKDENKKAFFNKMEDSVLKFNQNPTVENATDVHRAAYYSYITSGASNEYAKDDLTSFIATSALMGFVMNNSTTSYQVENFLISRLDDNQELNTYGEAFLRSGTHFVSLAKEGNSYIVQELDAFGNCVTRSESETSIMSLINDKALLKSMIRKADTLGQMVANANEKYLADELAKDQKIIESRKFVEYILSGNSDYRYALFNALGANFDNYNEFLKECFGTENVKEAELKLSSLSMNVSITGLTSHLGKLSETEINEISQTQKGKNIVAIYNKLISKIETKTLTLNEVVSRIDFSKLGGIYGINDNQAVGYLVNVRRDIFTRQYLNLRSSYSEEYHSSSKSESRRSSSSRRSGSSSSSSSSTGQAQQEEKVVEKKVETTESEEVQTKTETHTERKEVNKEDLTEKERKEAERQERKLDASNLIYNIAARASKDVNEYMNSNEYRSDSSTTSYVNKYNDQDLNNESLINQARLIRAWNDGSLSEISTSDSQIIAKKNEAAQNFVDSLSEEEQELLRSRYGSDWRSEAKSLYKKTWSNDLKSAFSKYVNSIGKGEYLRKYKAEEEKLNKENEQQNQNGQQQDNQVVLPDNQNNQNNQNGGQIVPDQNNNNNNNNNGNNEILPDETQDLGKDQQVVPDQNQNGQQQDNQVVVPDNQNNQNGQQNQNEQPQNQNNNQQGNEQQTGPVENEILPDESMGLGQGEQPLETLPSENDIAPIQEEQQPNLQKQNTNQNNQPAVQEQNNNNNNNAQPEQPAVPENAIQPEEIPNIDETTDPNTIEPVSLENAEAKGKVLTRRI